MKGANNRFVAGTAVPRLSGDQRRDLEELYRFLYGAMEELKHRLEVAERRIEELEGRSA